jgi:hypothetical protein
MTRRAPWMKTIVFLLGALWLLSGIAWADPATPQIMNFLSTGDTGESRTFTTGETFAMFATYFDSNLACVGVPPVLLQMLFFNLEGQLLFTCTTDTPTCELDSIEFDVGSKYRTIFGIFEPGALAPGAYDPYVLVRDCTNVNIFVLRGQTIRLITP